MPQSTSTTPQQPTPTLSSIFIAAMQANHEAHCTPCRDRHTALDKAAADNAASIARRDRLTLGLHTARRTAVSR